MSRPCFGAFPRLPGFSLRRWQKKIAVVNAYNTRNRGDFAIVQCQIVVGLRRQVSQREISGFFPSCPGQRRHAKAAVRRISGVACPPAPSLVQPGQAVASAVGCRQLVARPQDGQIWPVKLIQSFSGCAAAVISILHALPLLSRNLACLCSEILFAVRTGKPVIQFPQSFGPITKKAEPLAVQRVCRALIGLVPRFEPSAAFLTELGHADKIVLVPDIVLLMRRLLPEIFDRGSAGTWVLRRSKVAALPCGFPRPNTSGISGSWGKSAILPRKKRAKTQWYPSVRQDGRMMTPIIVDELAARLTQMGIPLSESPNTSGLDGIHFGYWPAAGVHRFAHACLHLCLFHAHSGCRPGLSAKIRELLQTDSNGILAASAGRLAGRVRLPPPGCLGRIASGDLSGQMNVRMNALESIMEEQLEYLLARVLEWMPVFRLPASTSCWTCAGPSR